MIDPSLFGNLLIEMMPDDKEIEEGKKRLTVFNYPIRDWLILGAVLSSAVGGTFFIGGTPNQISTSIEQQTTDLEKSFSKEISELRSSLNLHTSALNTNTNRINRNERNDSLILSELDSLRMFTEKAVMNLDGYFRGRRDQARENETKGSNDR